MLEFIVKYASIPVIITFFVTVISVFKTSEVEKQLETNRQRTIRDILNVFLLFGGLLFFVVIIFIMTQDRENTIDFSVDNSQYSITGKISENKILFVTEKNTKIVVKNGMYKKNIEGLKGGESYRMLNESGKILLEGTVPTKKEMGELVRQKNNLNLFCIMLAFIVFIGFLYYIFLPIWNNRKRKLYIKESDTENDQDFIILQSLESNTILLQKRVRDKTRGYKLLEIYKIVDKAFLSNKELTFETFEDVRNRRIMTYYADYKNDHKQFLTRYIFSVLSIFLILICGGIYFNNGNIIKFSSGCLFSLFIMSVYISKQYYKGKEMVKGISQKWRVWTPITDYLKMLKKYLFTSKKEKK